MRSYVVAFVLGLLVGVLSCGLYWSRQGESSASVEVPRDSAPATGATHEQQDATEGAGERIALDAPAEQLVSPQRTSADAPARATAKRAKPDFYWTPLPDLDACLKRKDLNPDGLVCPSAAVREQLKRLIREVNIPISELADSRNMLITEVARAKVAAGIDAKATWPLYPKEMVISKTGITDMRDGKTTGGETVVLKGDDPDLDAIIEKLKATKVEACEKLKAQIAALCQ